MKVAMVGLGDIARKAYLPLLAGTPGLELHLVTRNRDVLRELGAAYRIGHLHEDLDEALAQERFDAAFVHAATAAHPVIVEQLLRADVPVFVDKPLADNLPAARALLELADVRGLALSVGFNRRYAPAYAELRDARRDIVAMTKHRRANPAPPRIVVFDDFIHVVDTLLFLAPGPIRRMLIEPLIDGDLLRAVTLVLAGDGFTATGVMHRDSGLDEETLEVVGGGVRRRVSDLADRFVHDGVQARTRRGDWTPVAQQRGFEAMCAAFLEAVAAGTLPATDDILRTHEICEAVMTHIENPSAERPA